MQLNCCILDPRLIYHDERDSLTGSEYAVREDTDIVMKLKAH